MRVGFTMRIVENQHYPEQRDAVACDWGRFMGGSLCRKSIGSQYQIPLVT